MKNIFKKSARALLCALLAAIILYSGASSSFPETVSAAEVNDSNVQSMEEEIAALQKEQDELLGKIDDVKDKANETAQYKEYMDSLVTATAKKMELAEELIEELDGKISDSEQKIKETEAAIASTKDKVIERLRYAQDNGNISELELLLDAKGMSDFLSRIDKVNSIMDYDRRVLKEYVEYKEALLGYKETLETSKQTQKDTMDQLAADKESYEAISKENAAYMESLEADKEAYEAEYAKALAAEEELNRELTAYIKKMQEQSHVVPSGEGYIRPLPVGVGYISSSYGNRTVNGRPDYHQATDIACAQGTPIYAANSGKVLRAEWHYSYGNYVLIDHGGGISTLYAHCTSLSVGSGQMVEKGQVIGTVGQTGYAFGHHLHLEVRVNGERVNPAGYIPLS